MSTRSALIIQSTGVAEVKEIPRPKLGDDYILVKTKAVALNPTDWKSLYGGKRTDRLLGCDYAGIVEEVGKDVTTFKPGDKAAGLAFGASPHNDGQGAFSNFVIAKAHIATRINSDLSFADASTLGVGITTVGQALYQSLGLRLPPAVVEEPTSILIYGASTATGTIAVQFAKLGGLKVYATASPRNFDLLKSLGADEVFDYNDPECGSKIRAATNDSLYLVLDNISEYNSPAICAAAISSAGGRYTGLRSNGAFPRSDVYATFTMGYTAIGQEFSKMFPRNEEDVNFATRFWKISQDLINEGKIKPHPAEVREGGLQAIPQGLADLKEGRVSGAKLVYTLD